VVLAEDDGHPVLELVLLELQLGIGGQRGRGEQQRRTGGEQGGTKHGHLRE
jgi:hypothetical protein